MKRYSQGILQGMLGAAAIAVALAATTAESKSHEALFVAIGPTARPPIGWVEFCLDRPRDCLASPSTPRNATLTGKSWKELVRINKSINEQIRPITDFDHWGVPEKWSYPDDGYGDCEDYVLLKRRTLMQAGWPREALLITVVRDRKGDGHAVLTVKTDKGELILDNQHDDIMLWSETGYRFTKRQSQSDPNVWVELDDPRPAVATATAR
jgi:predicted transglutaminase-like cysteine proteinase